MKKTNEIVTDNGNNNLHVFLIADCSMSLLDLGKVNMVMIVQRIIAKLTEYVGVDIMLSLLCFGTDANWMYDRPINVHNFHLNRIDFTDDSNYGLGLNKLNKAMMLDVFISKQFNQYAPIVVFLGDAYSTDPYEESLDELKSNELFFYENSLFVAVGKYINKQVLNEYAKEVLFHENLNQLEAIIDSLVNFSITNLVFELKKNESINTFSNDIDVKSSKGDDDDLEKLKAKFKEGILSNFVN